ncbi:cellulase family glycosylhydrolase [Xanthobacter autotrophicus]|uniref:cellulase family glycosylhydrolase n=1 Tax=Xanthobacter autotrophicus TaxID=280 RepID=UPI003726AC85
MTRKCIVPGGRAALIAAGLFLSAFASTAKAADVKTLSFSRAPLAARQPPLVIGVGVHFGIGGTFNYVPETTAARIRDLGVDSFRDDLPWPVFDAPGAAIGQPQPARLFRFMTLTQAQPLLILGHSNPAVPGGEKPMNVKGRTAFADFTVRAAAATRPFNPMFEIWNEWNLTGGQRPPWLTGAGSPSDPRAATHYSALARAAVPSLRAADPKATILSGAAGIDPGWQWTKAIVQDGALEGASGLSVHYYNHCEPDIRTRTATDIVNRLTDLQGLLRSRTGSDVPIFLTEFGWPTANRPCVISRQAAADNIAQMLLWSAATPWLKGLWVYQLKDQGRDLDELEDNFGLYDYDYNPKPAACAVREAIRLIKAAGSFRLERPFQDLFVLQASTPEGIRLVSWTSRTDTRGILRFRGGEPHRATGLCNPRPAEQANGIAVGPEPVIIDIGAAQLTVEATLAP